MKKSRRNKINIENKKKKTAAYLEGGKNSKYAQKKLQRKRGVDNPLSPIRLGKAVGRDVEHEKSDIAAILKEQGN